MHCPYQSNLASNDVMQDSALVGGRFPPKPGTQQLLNSYREDGEIGTRRAPGQGLKAVHSSRVDSPEDAAGSPGSQLESEQLNRRQRARMADLSLLLEVVLKSTATRFVHMADISTPY